MCVIQFVCVPFDDVRRVQKLYPDVPNLGAFDSMSAADSYSHVGTTGSETPRSDPRQSTPARPREGPDVEEEDRPHAYRQLDIDLEQDTVDSSDMRPEDLPIPSSDDDDATLWAL
eukprot:12097998-Karenia_brevis.AAC.1